MKRIFSVFAFLCLTVASAFMLSACGEPDFYKITVAPSEYFEVNLYKGEELLSVEEDGNYVVENDAGISVKLYAKDLRADYTYMKIYVNGKEKEFFRNGTFNLNGNGDNYYCWFTLPMQQIKMDVTIEIYKGENVGEEAGLM